MSVSGINKDRATWGAVLEFKAKGVLFAFVYRVIEQNRLYKVLWEQFKGFARVVVTVWDFRLKL